MEESIAMDRRGFLKTAAVSGAALGSLGILGACTTEGADAAANEESEAVVEQTPSAETSSEKVYIVDTYVPAVGDGKAFLDEYMEFLKPLEEAVGMTHVNTTVAPPIWLKDDSNTIQIVWTVDDIAVGAWATTPTRYNPEYIEWFAKIRKRVVSRDRSYYASEEYMEVLNNV